MDGKRTYSIVINGITESISEVDKLLKKLDELGSRIDALANKSVTVNSKVDVTQTTNTSTSSSNSNASLSEETALQKEINKLKNEGVTLDAKIAATQDEVYQKVQATKDLYKEAIADQKQIAAQERLTADAYSNTMAGMKAKLADIKQVMQTVDLGDTDQFNKLTQEADKLNAKLLEIEKSYGQFGRQVGNYEIVNDGLGKVVIAVGGVEREFSNAREASRELSNELKSMAINGQQDTEAFKELQKAVLTLNSDIKDATVSSKAMDNLLDTMQSFAALGNISAGFSTLFGFDDSKVEEAIKKLMALQNALKGIESINQQMKSGEFMGGMLTKANSSIDAFVAKITGAKTSQDALTTSTQAATVAQQTLNATNQAGATASKTLAAAETAQATATKGATVATKGLSLALKSIGIGLVISAVAMLITYWKDIYKWFTNTVPALKKLETWFDKIRAVAVGVGTALVNYIVQPLATLGKTIKAIMEGNFKEIPNIIAEGFVKTFNVVGNFQKGYYKETERQQEEHNEKMRQQQKKANDEAEKDAEAKYGKDLKRTKEYYKKQMALTKEGTEEYKELQRKYWQAEREEREENNKKTLANQKKYSKEMSEEEKELSKLRIENMKEGLRKTITQLEEERKARLAKLNSNSKNYKELEANINKYYDKKIEDATKDHIEKTKEAYRQLYDSLISYQLSYYERYEKLNKTEGDNSKGILEEDLQEKLMRQRIGSYGIQGKNQYSPSTQASLGIISTSNDKVVEDTKKLIELKREYEKASTEAELRAITRDEELKDSIEALKIAEENYTHFYIEMEGERVNISDEEYKKRKDSILKQAKDIDEELKIIKEAYGEESELGKQMCEDIYAEREKLAKELTKLEGKKTLMTQEQYDTLVNKERHLLDNERAVQDARSALLEKSAEDAQKVADEKLRLLEEEKAKYNELYSSQEDIMRTSIVYQLLEEENYSKSLGDLFEQRLRAIETYWIARTTNERQFIEKDYNNQLEILRNKHEQETIAEKKHFDDLVALNDDWRTKERELVDVDLEDRKITKEEANKQFELIDKKYYEQGEQLSQTHANNLKTIDAQLEADQGAALIKKNDTLKKYNEEYFNETLQEFRDFQTALSNLESKQPVMNAFGIVNLKQTNKNNKELLQSYETLAQEIITKKQKINQEYEDGVIGKDAYESSIRELDSFSADLGDKMDDVKQQLSFGGQWEMLSQGINNYVQMVGQGISQIMSSFSEITQNQYQAQIDEQQKYIEEYEKLLDKQEEITKDHADKVNDIEDELKSARGDRRQQLIDNLNAEMAAQRASLAQEKKIEKDKEKAEQKKKKLEHDQAVAKKKMDLAQAFINAAMAISMAAVNKWPVPAIPMMAMAAAVGAAQIAAVQSQNIPSYGSGGLLEGKSHKEGGIKASVGRTPIELEGQEYVIRKKSTVTNLPVLDFINRSERKLNINDFIDFYSSGKVKKSIVSASPRTKFESGGQVIPTLRTDIDINDRLIQTMEDYSNRPVYVAVTEIENAQANVRNVRVLSGLEE